LIVSDPQTPAVAFADHRCGARIDDGCKSAVASGMPVDARNAAFAKSNAPLKGCHGTSPSCRLSESCMDSHKRRTRARHCFNADWRESPDMNALGTLIAHTHVLEIVGDTIKVRTSGPVVGELALVENVDGSVSTAEVVGLEQDIVSL
jgi:hypothetical protein